MWVKYGVIAITICLLGAVSGCADEEPGANPTSEPSPTPTEDAGVSSGSSGGSGSCAASLVLDGATYIGVGGVSRAPRTTGVTAAATLPGCNDTSDSDEQDEEVTVQELRDLSLEQGFAWQGSIFVREGESPPAQMIEWRTPMPCEVDGQFTINGDWVGITNPRGNTQAGWEPPYRLNVVATDAPELFSADDYESVEVRIRVTDQTDPALGPDDGKLLTTTGATVEATVHCEDSTYVADTITAAAQK